MPWFTICNQERFGRQVVDRFLVAAEEQRANQGLAWRHHPVTAAGTATGACTCAFPARVRKLVILKF